MPSQVHQGPRRGHRRATSAVVPLAAPAMRTLVPRERFLTDRSLPLAGEVGRPRPGGGSLRQNPRRASDQVRLVRAAPLPTPGNPHPRVPPAERGGWNPAISRGPRVRSPGRPPPPRGGRGICRPARSVRAGDAAVALASELHVLGPAAAGVATARGVEEGEG